MRHNPSSRRSWLPPAQRTEEAHGFSTLPSCHLFLHPIALGFQTTETKRLCARVAAGTTVVSDGGQWFQCIAWQPGIIHERHVTGSGRTAARHPAFHWANTVLANVKNSLLATHRAVAAKHLPRYLGA